MIRQISVFLENRAGQLADITGVLAAAGIDIRALNIAETADYGLLRIIAADCTGTAEVLKEHGYVTSVTEVVTIAVPDRPGALAEALKVLEQNQVDVQYMYSIFSRREGKAYMVMKLGDPAAAEKILTENGILVASGKELEIQ